MRPSKPCGSTTFQMPSSSSAVCQWCVIDREGNDPDDSSQITYGELLKQVCKFANVLKAKGLLHTVQYTVSRKK